MMRRMRLSIRLPLLIIVSGTVAICIVIVLSLFIIRNTVWEAETAALITSLKGYNSAIDFYLDEARAVIEITAQGMRVTEYCLASLAARPLRLREGSAERKVRNVAQSILKTTNVFEYLALFNADGIVYLLEPRQLQKQLSHKDLAFTDWYKKVMNTGQTVISDLRISPATQRPTVVIATPVRSTSGKIIGIWAGELNLGTLSKIGLAEPQTGTPKRYGYVTDSRGLIIAHQANPTYVSAQTDFNSVPAVQAALTGQQGTMQYICPIDWHDELTAYMPLTGTGWAVVYVVPTEVAFAPIYSLTRYIVLIGLLAAIAMGVGGLAIAQQVIKPLEQLRNAAITIGSGDLAQRTEVATGDEIGRLAAEFNRMAAALSDKEKQLLNYTTQLENTNKELEAFSYSVSHDLRAPLRAIDGFSRVVMEDCAEKIDDEGKRYLNIIRTSTQNMGQLIDDLLAFSRLGRQEIRVADIDMEALAKTVSKEMKRDVPTRKVTFSIQKLPRARADHALIRQVFTNLLSNAVKFTRPMGNAKIEVGSSNEKDGNVYYVKDNGVGFDMQYIDKLFGVFQRLHSSEEFEGTGVGLAIVQRIIHRHGGRVWAEGMVNEGATFYFSLPRK